MFQRGLREPKRIQRKCIPNKFSCLKKHRKSVFRLYVGCVRRRVGDQFVYVCMYLFIHLLTYSQFEAIVNHIK